MTYPCRLLALDVTLNAMKMILLFAMCLVFVLSACRTGSPTGEFQPTLDTETQTEEPDTTETPTPSVSPTPLVVAPIEATSIECENTPLTQMILFERGFVLSRDPRALNIRAAPGTSNRILGKISNKEIFLVLDGPACADNYAWYLIRYKTLEGWVAEGDKDNYYIAPYNTG